MDKAIRTSILNCLPLATALILASSSARAEDVESPQCEVAGSAALADCLGAKLKSADGRLNRIYSLVMEMLNAGEVDSTSFFSEKKKSLKAAERTWDKFRNTQCDAQAAMLTGASASGIVGVPLECQLDMIRERTEYLEKVARQLEAESKLCKKSSELCRVD